MHMRSSRSIRNYNVSCIFSVRFQELLMYHVLLNLSYQEFADRLTVSRETWLHIPWNGYSSTHLPYSVSKLTHSNTQKDVSDTQKDVTAWRNSGSPPTSSRGEDRVRPGCNTFTSNIKCTVDPSTFWSSIRATVPIRLPKPEIKGKYLHIELQLNRSDWPQKQLKISSPTTTR